ncbi:MAG TPA: invasion associated locus B family protein [Hyphomicrobiaceae bacterium]|nr:invasion associated locus B family protein [Hyphomicrobiaceae bacterium]
MANSYLHSSVGARLARVGAIAVGVALGGTLLLGPGSPNGALAQGKKDAGKAAAAKDGGSWVKLCDKGQLKGKDKAGKDIAKEVQMCMTLTEQIHPDSGMVMVGATLQQVKVDGKEKSTLSVTVLPGVALPPGAAITVFPKDLWEKVQKKDTKLDKADEEKLKKATVKLGYGYCVQGGCHAETEATPDLINMLKNGAGFMVHTVRMPGTPVSQPVPLAGFAQALANPPTDTKKFKEARAHLMKQIAERQKAMLAELKKQQDDLNKMQPNVTPKKK